MKTAIVYYSRRGGNWFDGKVVQLEVGNTELLSSYLKEVTGGDLFSLQMKHPYSDDYDSVVELGQKEVNEKFCPDLVALQNDVKDYDVIAIGTPTWWYTMAPAVRSFMSAHDFTGKTVIPFMTNAGWRGHVIKDMKTLAKLGTVMFDKEVLFESSGGPKQETPESEITSWANEIKSFLES